MKTPREQLIDEILNLDPCANRNGYLHTLPEIGLKHKLEMKRLIRKQFADEGDVLGGRVNTIDA